MKFALGENPKNCYNDRHETPITRMATAALIREGAFQGPGVSGRREKASQDEEARPRLDLKLEALIPVIQGKLPAHFHAHRADDIATAVRIGKEFGLDFVIIHGTEAHRIADLLAERRGQVVTGPIIGDRSKPELAHQRLDNTAILKGAGVLTAICTDHPENPQQYLPIGAAVCAKQGMDAEEAMAAITRTPPGSPAWPIGWAPWRWARTRTSPYSGATLGDERHRGGGVHRRGPGQVRFLPASAKKKRKYFSAFLDKPIFLVMITKPL